MDTSNIEVARKLREVAAAYTLKKGLGNLFQIKAYEIAADAVEKATSEIKDLWEEGRFDDVPGIGESLKEHLDELFKTGKVKHWEAVKKGIPNQVFKFLDIPGVGPKTASKLSRLGAKNLKDLEKKLTSGFLVKKGFSEKLAERIKTSLIRVSDAKSGRMLLPYAFTQAEKILFYLKKSPDVIHVDALGSLRRMVATVGDLDFAIASKNPQPVIEHITGMSGIAKVVEKGETKATIILSSGLQLDFLITQPEHYGALLQHFTGSKAHNIHLRNLAEKKELSLSEYGVKNIKTNKIHPTASEEEFYQLLGMETPPPEIREDSGEIEAALKHKLPHLVKLKDIKGDLHVHSSFPMEPSHDLGIDSIEKIVRKAGELGYSYIGISDHQPSQANHTPKQMIKILQKRTNLIEHINYSQRNIRVLNLLEIDILPDGSFSVPEEGLKFLDFALAGIHSVHYQTKEKMTARILKALTNPFVKILSHPTNRLLNKREASDVDWPQIFLFAAKNNKALEINAYPDRLDLVDSLVREALSYGVKLIINTDSHEVEQMENMRFGVAVARRGWATQDEIVNTWDWTRFAKWFKV